MQAHKAFNILSLLLLLGIVACNEEKKCPYGSPKPIFSPSMNGVENHSFEREEQKAIEQVTIPEYDFSLEIQQSGCEQLVQTFRFDLEGEVDRSIPAPACANIAATLFHGLSQLDPELTFFSGWRDAIHNKVPNFQFNTLIDLSQQGYQARIDKIHNPNSFLLLVELVGPEKE